MTTPRAPIPDEGELRLGPVRLPAGRILRTEGHRDEPVAWITETAESLPAPWQTGPEWAEEREWAAEMTAPFTTQCPGLAPAIDTALPPSALEAALQDFPAARIALVPATRPADVLPVLGWIPGNWESAFPADAPVGFATVLRSWEERFGARLFALSHDQAWLLVERPPGDLDAALPVAAEHFVFCDEPAGRQPVRQTAADIAGAPLWYFWWD
jgi:Domain of unknown function (DUF4253)